ncbi:enoyl-CoA hydratase/isomerase family protein [sulfur-oxidizing endosymbiont of Gigantopelta aegis]|uniref:enoyl-CoA hydratase/isomerase family protein n=1 Tax=sulfur-oxidizing endosymbiont of Gigantopelta aegis TaxID=2794934 RepID=UPI0018DD6F99|nr:enoyl-CoA hydratase/isomerase family protein [sulfur-oxidizing endosymbiont of Gigantopelta aegis]
MKDYSDFDSEIFSCQYEGETAVICLKAESFRMAMDASKMHEMLDCLNTIEVDKNIKGILTLHTAEYERIELLQTFIKSIQKKSGYVQKEMGVTRYGNAVKRLTLAINEFSKPNIVAIRGQVSIDSFGFFLACDYRIAADDLCIEFPGLKIGVTPVGAVSFFMNRQLGMTKTMEILQNGETIDAQEANSLSLVSEVVSGDDLKATCLAKLDAMYQVPGATLSLTKQLVRPKTYELEEHFDVSSRLMWHSIIDN